MKILIYGHSQSGGMGLDFQKLLKSAGHQVTRVTEVGWNDDKLKGGIPKLTGDPGQYDLVYYFGGGNSDSPSADTLKQIVDMLGGKNKVTVILPPYNDSKVPANIMDDPTTKGYINQKALEDVGVRVFRQAFPASDFWPDKIHLRPYSKSSANFASMVLFDKPAKFPYIAASICASMVLAAVLVSRKVRK